MVAKFEVGKTYTTPHPAGAAANTWVCDWASPDGLYGSGHTPDNKPKTAEHPTDWVEVPDTKTVWLNIYSTSEEAIFDAYPHESEAAAKKAFDPDTSVFHAIAVPVTLMKR